MGLYNGLAVRTRTYPTGFFSSIYNTKGTLSNLVAIKTWSLQAVGKILRCQMEGHWFDNHDTTFYKWLGETVGKLGWSSAGCTSGPVCCNARLEITVKAGQTVQWLVQTSPPSYPNTVSPTTGTHDNTSSLSHCIVLNTLDYSYCISLSQDLHHQTFLS